MLRCVPRFDEHEKKSGGDLENLQCTHTFFLINLFVNFVQNVYFLSLHQSKYTPTPPATSNNSMITIKS